MIVACENEQDSIVNIVDNLLPDSPLYVYRINSLIKAATFFVNNFRGETLYAVKANPDPLIIKKLYNAGIKKFDVASLQEIRSIKSLFPDAELYFMHPVKSRDSIKKAYYDYGVRHFALDTHDELEKIIEVIHATNDTKLHVRLSVPNDNSAHKLSQKFGVRKENSVSLLKECSKVTNELGICFHVGTQCMDPNAYRVAIRLVKELIEESAIEIRTLDLGGGFPSIYAQSIPESIQSYMDAIHEEVKACNLDCELLCEPGRALVAESGAIIAKVELRKGQILYLNDGKYGNLFDASGELGYLFPVRLIRQADTAQKLLPFSFFGPTCDSTDFIEGPFMLPSDIKVGDYIEIGQVGSYGTALATSFNGFSLDQQSYVFTNDPPIMSMYD